MNGGAGERTASTWPANADDDNHLLDVLVDRLGARRKCGPREGRSVGKTQQVDIKRALISESNYLNLGRQT